MNRLTDQQLLRDYAGCRSEAAFAELVRRHVDLVYSAALRMVRDAHLAEDVTQGVFMAFAQNARQLVDRPVLSGWLHRTAQNLAANVVRTDTRRRAREQEAAAMNELLANEPDAAWEHIAPHLDAALGELSDADRDALLLRYFERKSAQEMAQVLGVSDDAAQKRVSRAVERLREFLAKHGITIGASGLVPVIAANAIQAAPTGLTAAITAAALAGTTIAATATTTIGKAIAMTTLQKTLIAAALAAVCLGLLVTSVMLFRTSRPVGASNSGTPLGWVQLGKEIALHGLAPANQQHDGVTTPSLAGGLDCHSLQLYPGRPELYAYFRIDQALKGNLTNFCIVEVEYFDGDAGGHFRLDYDSYDESNRSLGAYTQSKERVNLKGTQRWRRARFLLDDARFQGRQNDQADFRVTVVGARFFLRSVKVIQE